MTTAPVECAASQNCSDVANSECVDTSCHCVFGFVMVVGGYDVTEKKWRRVCRRRKLYEDAPRCKGRADCNAAVPGSFCDSESGQCFCQLGFVAGQTLNASCVRLSTSTCRANVDCSDAIPDTRCDSSGRCQCDVRMSDDGTGNGCVLRPIGGFCRDAADCVGAVPDSQCGTDDRCQCISGFYAVGADSSSPVCLRRRVGSACHVTSDCSDAFIGSDCVHGSCACRREFIVANNGASCRRRRIDNGDDAVCDEYSDDCATTFANSICGDADRCECVSGYRPDDKRVACVRRRFLSDSSPCRNDTDCSVAIPNSHCDPPTRRCACPTGYRSDHSTFGSDICRRRIVGDLCSVDAHCSAILSGKCDSAGLCACVTGYGIPTSGGVDCRRRLIGGEVGCESDKDCSEGIRFSVCQNASCACLPGHLVVDNATACARRKFMLTSRCYMPNSLKRVMLIALAILHKLECLL